MPDSPEPIGSELVQLTGYLDAQRAVLLRKSEGLTGAQLSTPHPPSTLTLGGLLNHAALNEDWWFGVRFKGLPQPEPWAGVDWDADEDWEFHTAHELEPEELRARYDAACARSRAIVEEAQSLDDLSTVQSSLGTPWNLRWIILHMIEETARHAGHADLIREAIDGSVGE